MAAAVGLTGGKEPEEPKAKTFRLAGEVGLTSVPANTRVRFTAEDYDTDSDEDDPTLQCDFTLGSSRTRTSSFNYLYHFKRQEELETVILNFLSSGRIVQEEKKEAKEEQNEENWYGRIDIAELKSVIQKFDVRKLLKSQSQLFMRYPGGKEEWCKYFREDLEEDLLDWTERINSDDGLDTESSWRTGHFGLSKRSRVSRIHRSWKRMRSGPPHVDGIEPAERSSLTGPEADDAEGRPELVKEVKETEEIALKILSQYPFGVEINVLGKMIQSSSSASTPTEQVLQRSQVLTTVRNDRNDAFVFPAASTKNLRQWDTVERGLYHLILILIKLNPSPVPVATLASKLNDLFGLRFSTFGWVGSDDVDDLAYFYRRLFRMWDIGYDLQVGLIPVSTNIEEPCVYCTEIGHYAEDLRDMLERNTRKQRRTRKHDVQGCPPKPSDFVSSMDQMPMSVADAIHPGTSYQVQPDFIVSPVGFNVSFTQNNVMRDDFIEEMTKFYDKWKDWIPRKKLPLELKAVFAIHVGHEWLRGRIMWKRKGSFELYLVDLGENADGVQPDELLPLHKDFACFPEQTFTCKLSSRKLGKAFDLEQRSLAFSEECLEGFYELIAFKDLSICPLSRDDKNIWEVDVTICQGEERQVVISDVASAFVALHSGQDPSQCDDRNYCEDQHQNLPCPSSWGCDLQTTQRSGSPEREELTSKEAQKFLKD